MLFGEIVEPSTRALIYDDEEYPEDETEAPNWKGTATLDQIDTLLFVEGDKVKKLVKKFVIGDRTPTLTLENGGLQIYKIINNKYVVVFEEEKKMCKGEIVEAVKSWFSKTKNLYCITSEPIASYQNIEMSNKPEFVIKSLSTNKSKTDYGNLETPNLVTGLGANVLSYCIHSNLVCTLYVMYMDNTPLDSRNCNPLLELIKKLGFSVLPCDLKIQIPSSNLYM